MAGLQLFPTEMWDYRDEHGCWSIREHLVHIADSEANSYIRCRRLIAEPGEQLMAYDENAWSRSLFYSDQGVDDALALFRLLRSQTYTLDTILARRSLEQHVPPSRKRGYVPG